MLQTLELINFKSYNEGLFGFEPGVNIIVGPNASGKTNLLEAIHVIATLKSFKSQDQHLLTTDASWARLEAMTDNGVRVVKLQHNQTKIMEIDGDPKKRLNDQHGLPVVVFEPEHMLLLSSEPERRRSYIDGILSATKPGYKSLLADYKRTLAQRNRLLKSEITSGNQLFVWDIQLAQKAGLLAKTRVNLIETLNKKAPEVYSLIASNNDLLELSYSSKFTVENYSEQMISYMQENVSLDKQRGFTGAGVHRDDVLIELKDSDARVSASRGETRSIVLALKISELTLLNELLDKKPVLLLDDVFSELDGSRRRALAEALQGYQTFLTTTDADVAVDHFSQYNIIPIQQ